MAVLLVVLGHAGVPFLAGGFVGVDVFFVISGFLITTLLVRELRDRGTISVKRFYSRRATRLLPTSAVVLTATLVGAWLWLPVTRITAIAGDAVAASFYAVNYRLAATGTDYLTADAPPSPVQHYWSLAVEEQFYLVWPLLLIGVTLLWGRTRFHTPAMVVTLLIIAAGSLYLSARLTPVAPSWSYFGGHTRAWELACGGLLALAVPLFARLPRPVTTTAGWAGLALITAAAVGYDQNTPFPGVAALLPVTGSALVVAAGCAGHSGGARRLLDRPPMQFVGRMSYSFYLWHWPVLLIAPVALGRPAGVGFNLLAATAALGVTWITYHLVENPVRRRSVWRSRPWRGIGLGASLTVFTSSLAVAAALLMPMVTMPGGTATDTASELTTASALDSLRRLITRSGTVEQVPANLKPALDEADADRPAVYADGCILGITDSRLRNKICEYGDTEADTTVVLFGDSHAAQWLPALDTIAREQGWKVVPLTRAGCAVASVTVVHKLIHRRYTECTGWREQAYDIMADLDPAMVLTTSINGQTPVDRHGEPLADENAAMVHGWRQTFAQLKKRAGTVVYLVDTPNFGRPVPDCVARHLRQLSACAVQQDRALLLPGRTASIEDLAARIDVGVIDPVPWFCVDNLCPPVVGDTLLFRDSNHITTVYSTVLAPILRERLPKP